MENGGRKRWGFQGNEELDKAASITIRGVLNKVMSNLNPQDHRPVIPLGHGDPSAFSCFRTTPIAEDAIVDALRSRKFNSYAPAVGILPARRYEKWKWFETTCFLKHATKNIFLHVTFISIPILFFSGKIIVFWVLHASSFPDRLCSGTKLTKIIQKYSQSRGMCVPLHSPVYSLWRHCSTLLQMHTKQRNRSFGPYAKDEVDSSLVIALCYHVVWGLLFSTKFIWNFSLREVEISYSRSSSFMTESLINQSSLMFILPSCWQGYSRAPLSWSSIQAIPRWYFSHNWMFTSTWTHHKGPCSPWCQHSASKAWLPVLWISCRG